MAITYTIRQSALVNGCSSTAFCADAASSRYALGTVCIDIAKHDVTFVATCGRRLAATTYRESHDVTGRVLIPVRIAKDIGKAYKHAKMATIVVDGSKTTVNLITGRNKPKTIEFDTIEGIFPQYERIFPTTHDCGFDAEADDILNSFGGGLSLSVNGDVTVGRKPKPIAVKKDSRFGDIDILLDQDFLTDWLSMLGTATVKVRATDRNSAILLECDQHRLVVMPLCG